MAAETKKVAMPAVDLLEEDASQCYFETRECQSFYGAIKHATPRRDFHFKLIPVCTRFLQLTSSPNNEALIDVLIDWSVKNSVTRNDWSYDRGDPGRRKQNIADEVQRRHPHGYHILGLESPLTLDALKSAYRSAAKRYHPDRGGSHDDMVELNEAHVLLEDLLYQESLRENITPGATPSTAYPNAQILTCQDYRYFIARLLFAVHLDDWAVDQSFQYLRILVSSEWRLVGAVRQHQSKSGLCEDCAKLATRLALAGMQNEAKFALQILEEGVSERQIMLGTIGLLNVPSSTGVLENIRAVLQGTRKPNIVLNHRRQADNAVRLNIVSRAKYELVVAKLLEAENARNDFGVQQQIKVQDYTNRIGFLRDLPPDEASVNKLANSRLVPEPGYFSTKLAGLTDDQQAEYAAAFGVHASSHGVCKYFFVRLQSLLETAILHKGDGRLVEIEREGRFLSTLVDNSCYSYVWFAVSVADVIRFLMELAPTDREQRLFCLRRLHSMDAQTTIAGEFSVQLNARYFDIVRWPLVKLQHITDNPGGGN
ncbi:MAG TPA: J domain-containing protein [Tepidisphaeraceae bacterium]|jgi:hypothetical protein|nr:J domain-containing protein [Tepidisphaeraceae bacterium]